MILADKILNLRKKNGWSQEELAEKLGVSRQSVSKWEGAQSIPDIDKILQMAGLFGVTTDYLLRDELEEESRPEIPQAEESSLRRVSLEEADAFLRIKEWTAPRIALGVLLCILSPVCLIVLGGAAELSGLAAMENMATGLGLIVLLLMVGAAVALFIWCGAQTNPYEFLENEDIETAYGVDGMVRQRREQQQSRYVIDNIIGVCLCVLSPVWIFVGIFAGENEFLMTLMVGLLLVTVGIGVAILVNVGIPHEGMKRLLQEGEYSRAEKRNRRKMEPVSGAYWMAALAIFLLWSFLSGDWGRTWIVWPVAGVLYAAVAAICSIFLKNK